MSSLRIGIAITSPDPPRDGSRTSRGIAVRRPLVTSIDLPRYGERGRPSALTPAGASGMARRHVWAIPPPEPRPRAGRPLRPRRGTGRRAALQHRPVPGRPRRPPGGGRALRGVPPLGPRPLLGEGREDGRTR